MKIYEKLKEIRLTESLTQKKFAEILEVDERSIQNYEADKTVPSALVVEALCKYYPEYTYWLMTGNVDPENNHLSPDIKLQILPDTPA